MRLPTPIYERLPQFWLLLGLLFMSTGTWLGFDYPVTFIYFAIGTACIFWSFCVVALRPRKPDYTVRAQVSIVGQRPSSDDEEPLKQSRARPHMEPMVDLTDGSEEQSGEDD